MTAVIRLVRLRAENDLAPAGLAELVAAGELDLLQLDYERPRFAPVAAMHPELPEQAASFDAALRCVARTLFLEPTFRVTTNAGWSNSYQTAERAAAILVELGCPETPVAAVRGSNILPILDDLLAGGVRLDNVETGAPLRTLREPILAADVEFGGGPLATALAEGARVIVAGNYDGAAPLLAAALHAGNWTWKQLDLLASAAAAARASLWSHRHAGDWLSEISKLAAAHGRPRVQLSPRGEFTVDLGHPLDAADAEAFRQWLTSPKGKLRTHEHADVAWDATGATVELAGPTQLRVRGIIGAKSDDSWRLKILYQRGFLAETMLEFTPAATADLRRQVADAFAAHFVDDDDRSLVTVQELAPTESSGAAASWMHLACRSKLRAPCVEFADHVARFGAANRKLVRLAAGRPVVHVECGVWRARMPRNAIDVAVDTRAAREWE
jgi:hypothetical protein